MSTRSFSFFRLGPLEALLDAGVLLLTPNQRLARSIKSVWDQLQIERGLKVWHPARVKALDIWFSELWDHGQMAGMLSHRVRLDTTQARELWLKVIADDCAAQGNYSLLQSGSAADLAANARDSLIQARLDYRKKAVRSEFELDTDCATFLRWIEAFDARLDDQHSVTASDMLRALVEAAPADHQLPEVAMVHVQSLTPLQQACVDRYARLLPSPALDTKDADIACHSYPDRPAELTAIAHWAAMRSSQNPEARLGIVLRDMQGDRARLEYELRRAFDCFGDNYTALPVNFSTAVTLDQAPVIRDALRMLRCGSREIGLAEVIGLLRSRFCLPEFASDPALARFVEQLYADGRETIELSRLRFHARNAGAREEGGALYQLWEILSALQSCRLNSLRQTPSEWVNTFRQLLDLWHWPGSGALDSLEYQQVESWYRLQDNYAGLNGVSGELGFEDALSLLLRCCQSRMSQPKTPESQVQVLGPLEAAGLQFDELWIGGFEGSQWPEPPRPNPFIPLRLQRKHAMPHASSEQQWQYADALWGQYLAGCAQLHASYARQLDNAPQLPSPFLQRYEIAAHEEGVAIPPHWNQLFAAARIDCRNDTQAPPLPAGQAALSGGSALLKDQGACPFRAFAYRRLRLEPLGDSFAGLSPLDRGNLLHGALQAFWTVMGSRQALEALSDQARSDAIESAVNAALDSVPDHQRILIGMHCLQLEGRRLRQLLEEWLQQELKRDSFVVEANEAPCKFTLAGKELTLRVDRVDRLADGRRLVIDYKSGKCSINKWRGERPDEPQLPLYSIATNAAAIAFAQVRARECKLLGVGDVGDIPGISDDLPKALAIDDAELDWADANAGWRYYLETLMQEFIDGEARVDPQPNACNYCGLQSLCRIEAEQGANTGEGVEE